MTKSFIYLDQNILDPSIKVSFELKDNQELVYSKEHFQEIERSKNPDKYLKLLEKLEAKLLDVELDTNFNFTGNAIFHETGTPKEHFESYLEAMSDVNIENGILDPFQAWVNGGGNEKQLKDLPIQMLEQFKKVIEVLPNDMQETLMNDFNDSQADFKKVIEQMLVQGNDLKKTREAVGSSKGEIGNVSGDNQIEQIWSIIEPNVSGVTCDQFFGFEALPVDNAVTPNTYQSIIACCSVFDIIGFKGEKKARKIDKIPNVRSDATHIAMASFCSAIISKDRKLIARAKAIYDYRNIITTTYLITE